MLEPTSQDPRTSEKRTFTLENIPITFMNPEPLCITFEAIYLTCSMVKHRGVIQTKAIRLSIEKKYLPGSDRRDDPVDFTSAFPAFFKRACFSPGDFVGEEVFTGTMELQLPCNIPAIEKEQEQRMVNSLLQEFLEELKLFLGNDELHRKCETFIKNTFREEPEPNAVATTSATPTPHCP